MNLLIALGTVLLISAIRADYFDILEKEYNQTVTGKVRRFYITAEEEVWDYASQISTNVPSETKKKHVLFDFCTKPTRNI